MNEKVQVLLSEAFDSSIEKAQAVADIITDYFGESLVDAKLLQKDAVIQYLSNNTHIDNLVLADIYKDDNVSIISRTTGETVFTTSRERWNKVRLQSLGECVEEDFLSAAKDRIVRRLEAYINSEPIEILIRFPNVTVTNEYGKSIDITELYTRVRIYSNGTMSHRFDMIRSEYTTVQYMSGYAHSHLPGAYLEWMQPCLGSGPIYSTMHSLMSNFDENIWGLFCYELSKYVTVESVAGVPYIRLETVGARTGGVNFDETPMRSYTCYRTGILNGFIRHYINTQEFKVSFSNGVYAIGEDYLTFTIKMSRDFIDWYNRKLVIGVYNVSMRDLISCGILRKYLIVGKQLYTSNVTDRLADIENIQGRELFTFKGEPVRVNFLGSKDIENSNEILLLKVDIVSAIVARFLMVINHGYKNKKEEGYSKSTEITPGKKYIVL